MTSSEPILPQPDPAPPAATSPPPASGMAERMRSLVSQVAATPTIDETTSRVIGLQHAISELATRMGKIETQLRDLAAELAARATPAQEREEITKAMHAALEQSMRTAVEQVVTERVPKLFAAETDEIATKTDQVAAETAKIATATSDLRAETAKIAAEAAKLTTGTAKIAAAMAKATGESEQRMVAHVDEAVLALAEALLTTRPRAASPPPAPAPPPAANGSTANGTPANGSASNPAPPPRSSIGALLEDEDYVPPDRVSAAAAAAEAPDAAGTAAATGDALPEGSGRRRWWRGNG